MNNFTYLLLFLVCYILTNLFKYVALRLQITDVPNQRSSHYQTKPRAGGIVFTFLWFVCCYFFYMKQLLLLEDLVILLPGPLLVAIVGLLDDIRGLSNRLRLFCQILAGLLFISLINFSSIYWWFLYK